MTRSTRPASRRSGGVALTFDRLGVGYGDHSGNAPAAARHVGDGAVRRGVVDDVRQFGTDVACAELLRFLCHDSSVPRGSQVYIGVHKGMARRPYFSLLTQEPPLAVSKRLRHEIFRRDNHTCQSCGAKAPDVKLEPDHVIPVTLGGSDDPSNLQTLCEDCNAGKSATPPDASTVAKVAEDALRWSRAMDYAATLLLNDQESRQSKREHFLANWRRWHWGNADDPVYAPLPATWEKSVDQILAAGLPAELLKDCIDTAFAYEKVKPENKFKYACGVAWRKVDKLRDIAKAALDRTDPSGPRASDGTTTSELSAEVDHLLTDLFDLLTAEEHKLHEVDPVQALTLAVDEDGDFPIVTALDAALCDLRSDLATLSYAVDDLLRALPRGVGEHAMKVVRFNMHDRWGDELHLFTRHRFAEQSVWTTVQMLRELDALAHLDDLSEDERKEWFAYGRALAALAGVRRTDPSRELLMAAEAARVIKDGRYYPAMCAGPGKHILFCPEPAAFWALLDGCACCTNSQPAGQTQHGFCDLHLEQVMDSGIPMPDGLTLTVRDYGAIERSQEDPPF